MTPINEFIERCFNDWTDEKQAKKLAKALQRAVEFIETERDESNINAIFAYFDIQRILEGSNER